MRTKSIKVSLISLFALLLVSLVMAFGFVTTKTVKADASVFRFEDGAYVKIKDNGGLRFRLQMSEDVKGILESGSKLYLYAASANQAGSKNTVSEWNALKNAGKAWKNEIAADRIYDGGDGYYYANYLLNLNVLGATNAVYRTTEFVAFAAIDDGATYSAVSVKRSLQYTASAGVLRSGYYSEVTSIYTWLGGADYPLLLSRPSDYDAYKALLAEHAGLVCDLSAGYGYKISGNTTYASISAAETQNAYLKLDETVSATDGFVVSADITTYGTNWPKAGFALEDENGKVLIIAATDKGYATRYGTNVLEYSTFQSGYADDNTDPDGLTGTVTSHNATEASGVLKIAYKDGTVYVYSDTTLVYSYVITDRNASISTTGNYNVYLAAFQVKAMAERDDTKPFFTWENVKINDPATMPEYNVTFKYADGQQETVVCKFNTGLLSTPTKYALAHREENGLAVSLKSGNDTAEYFAGLTDSAIVEYKYVTGGGNKLSVSNDSLTTVEFGKNGTGTVTTSPYITATEESFNTLSFVRLADTVSGEYTLSAHFDTYADSTITGFKVTDQNGNYLLFGFGSKNNRVLLGKNGVGNQGTTLQSSPSYVYSSVTAHNGKETVGGVDRWRYDYKITVYKNGNGDWAAKFRTRNTDKADISSSSASTGWVDRTTFVLKDVINAYASSYFAYAEFDWEGTLNVDIMMLNNKKEGDKAIVEISQWNVVD